MEQNCHGLNRYLPLWKIGREKKNTSQKISIELFESELSKDNNITLMCLSIGTPKNNKFSICPKWKIHYFQVSQNLGRVQPQCNLFEY